MAKTTVSPIFRIFDYSKAKEFYIDWLGFKIDWEDKNEGSPLYMQVSKGDIIIHLSEHHGDSTPGSKVFITTTEVKAYHSELMRKEYKFNRPGLEKAPWKTPCFEVIDPFGNKLLFTEESK